MSTRWLVVILALLIAAGTIALTALNSRRYDVRDHPLAHPINVTVADDGVLRLADGRTTRIAGVAFPGPGPRRDAAIGFLRVAVKQGVEVRTDIGDGSAMLTCEPRFYNWCGTGRIGGWYVPCGLNELLVAAGYVTIDPNAKVTEMDAERLRVAAQISADRTTQGSPTPYYESGIRCANGEQEVARIDQLIEMNLYPKKP